MPFTNPILAGNSLARPVEKSPNYVTGVSGWAIFKDGSVEFNSGTFRGTVTAGIFQGTDFIINPAGAFFYSGTPALGNLILSIANAPGTDQFGNSYGDGFDAGGRNGNPYIQVTPDFNGEAAVVFWSNRSDENTPANVTLQVNNAGLGTELLINQLTGPSTINRPDYVLLGLASSAQNGTGQFAGAFLEYHDGHGNAWENIIASNNGVYLPYVNTLAAQVPGATTPTSETQHAMSLASGFNIGGSGNYANYWVLPDGRIHIEAFVTVTSGPGLTFKAFTSSALGTGLTQPSAYHPSVNRFGVLSANELAVFTGSNNAGGLVQLATSGQLFVYGAATGATSLYFNCDMTP